MHTRNTGTLRAVQLVVQGVLSQSVEVYRVTSLIRPLPPQEHHRALGMVLLLDPSGALFTVYYERGTPVQGYLAHKKTPFPLGTP